MKFDKYFMMNKYVPIYKGKKPGKTQGRNPDPSSWISGPDPIQHEKYYAYLKHKSQARFRKEEYELTWEQWNSLWPHELFFKRGRGRESLCISRTNIKQSWNINNVKIIPRYEHLKRAKEYRVEND